MRQYVIYLNPTDYPGKAVVRGFSIGPGWIEPDAGPLYVGNSMAEARAVILARDPGLIRMDAGFGDEPQIFEIWI
jgi:hypothetical protein